MHSKALFSLALAGFASAAKISCAPYYTGQFLAYNPDLETSVPAGFINGVVDAQGRKIVSIDNNGKSPAPMALTFFQCFSQFMRSGQTTDSGTTVTYGIVTGAKHVNKCITLSSVLKATGPTYTVSSDCKSTDTVANQLPQWFKLTEQPSSANPNVINRYLSIDGSPNTTSTLINYGYYSLKAYQSKKLSTQLNGKAVFLEYLWSPSDAGTDFTFGIGNPL
ncbi:hypothetical protein OC846_000889 [Tilletia horrida]|uniref:Uncharacterized protein n=1 Tax=Tilletia horrida TaxID=155126 RepID=A0AAN6JTI6_9BASI|nr:hypothetical protein OC845_001157 [Tilletia horrida]KAK0556862.1 hypothetical protein OC846_000889 [Tilletia horrida]KAK0569204.1 hypothetical protein OC861_001130 [Tilletia horrida]